MRLLTTSLALFLLALVCAVTPPQAQKVDFGFGDDDESDAERPEIPSRPPFAELDENGDGVLDEAESKLTAGEFSRIDVIEDGVLEADEWTAEETELKLFDTRKTLIDLHGAMRTSFIRFDVYPRTLQDFVDWELVSELPTDAWGNEIKFNFARDPNQPAKTFRQDTMELPNFEFRSAGMDGEMGTTDDIFKTRMTCRVPATRIGRAKLKRGAGESYQKAKLGFAYEQAFRLWIAILTHQVENDLEELTLDGFTLPREAFPQGVPIDVFGREFELKSARGITALCLPEVEDGPPALVLTEANFYANYVARMESSVEMNYPAQELIERLRQFWTKSGRVAVTEEEAPQPYWRSSNSGQTFYYEINIGENYAIFSFGMDNKPGGIGQDMDWAYYGPDARMDGTNIEAFTQLNWTNYQYTQHRYESLIRAIAEQEKRAAEAEEGAEDSAPEEAGAAEKADAARAEAVEKGRREVIEAIEEKAAEKAEEKADEAKSDDNAGEKNEAEPEPEPEAEKSDSDGSDDADPKALEDGDEEGNEDGEGKGDAEGEGETDEVPAPAPEAPTFRYEEDLIPSKLYTEDEAEELGVTGNGYYWYHQEVMNTFMTSVRSFASNKKSADAENQPCGNVDLSNGEALRTLTGEPWKQSSNSWYDPWDEIECLVIAHFKRVDEPSGGIERCLLIMIPKADAGVPVMVYSVVDGTSQQVLFANVSDQPEGWGKWAASVNGRESLEENPVIARVQARIAEEQGSTDKPVSDTPKGFRKSSWSEEAKARAQRIRKAAGLPNFAPKEKADDNKKSAASTEKKVTEDDNEIIPPVPEEPLKEEVEFPKDEPPVEEE